MEICLKYILILFAVCVVLAVIAIIFSVKNDKYSNYKSTHNANNGSDVWNAKEIGADFYGRPSQNRYYSASNYDYCDKSKSPIDWPPIDGCLEKAKPFTVKKGTIIDRFGGPTGFFVSPQGYSYAQRSLPYISSEDDCVNYYKHVYDLANPLQNYHLYVVNKDIEVLACEAAPAFGAPGGAIQYKYSNSIKQLLDDNIISEIPVKDFPPFK